MLKQDNIVLNLENNVIEVETVRYDRDEKSIFVQVKHTLIDTSEGMDCFSGLNKVNENPFYYGYISIGEVLEAGNNVHYCRKGMQVLIPATYQKFIVISDHEKQRLSRTIFHVLPDSFNADVIQILFYPLLCAANALIEQLKETETVNITLAGCHAFGGILMKLCRLNDISCEVILGTKDVSPFFVEQNGGRTITLSEDLLEKAEKVIILEKLSELKYIKVSDSEKYIHVNNFIEKEYGTSFWRNSYIQTNSEEILKNHDIDVSDMIGQHVHAEAAEETYRYICEDKYQGKLLVYDW